MNLLFLNLNSYALLLMKNGFLRPVFPNNFGEIHPTAVKPKEFAQTATKRSFLVKF